MKNLMSIRKQLFTVSVIAFSLVFFASCSKNNNGNNNDVSAAGLMAFNLAPNKPAIGFSLSGNSLTSTALAYTNYTGNYLGVYTGTRSITAFDANTNSSITSTEATFDKDKYYSLFLVGDSTYQNIVVSDNIDSLSGASGMAYVRYINAIPDSSNPIVTLTQGGNNVVNENAAFTKVSGFTPFTAGDITIAVNNNSGIQASRNITLEQRKVYTALLIGIPGSTDTAKAIKVRYVENGTLSADSTTQGFSKASPKVISIH